MNLNNMLTGLVESDDLVLYVDNTVILYNKYVVSEADHGFRLSRINGDLIHVFNLKSSAITAANYYLTGQFKRAENIKLLDNDYYSCLLDSKLFYHLSNSTNDANKKSIFLSRYLEYKDRSKALKKEIFKYV